MKKTPENRSNKKPNWKESLQSKKSILLFWGGFLLFILLYFGFSYFPFYDTYILKPVSTAYAKFSSIILNIFGYDTTSFGVNLNSPQFSVSVKKGCDGIAATIFYVAGVLMVSAKKAEKWKGIYIGVLLLLLLNLIRVISLFLVGIYLPDWFDFMHIEFWQVVFISSALFIYGTWLYWVYKQNRHDKSLEAAT